MKSPKVAKVFVDVFLLRLFVDAGHENDPAFDGLLRLAALSSSLSVAVSQSFVPVVSGMFYLVVDYVCVFKASALRREIQ